MCRSYRRIARAYLPVRHTLVHAGALASHIFRLVCRHPRAGNTAALALALLHRSDASKHILCSPDAFSPLSLRAAASLPIVPSMSSYA